MMYCSKKGTKCIDCISIKDKLDCHNNTLDSYYDGMLMSSIRVIAEIFGGEIIPENDHQNKIKLL